MEPPLTDSGGIEIRPVRATDFAALITLFRAVAAERRWIGTQPGFDERAYRARWRRALAANGDANFVAVAGGRIVGMIGIHPAAEHGCEIGMLVQAERRGRGIGSLLLRTAIEWARARGERALALLVFPHNAAAIALYERHGFEHVRRLAAYSKRQTGETWDALLMTLPLTKE